MLIIVEGQLKDDVEELFSMGAKKVFCGDVLVDREQEIDKARKTLFVGVIDLDPNFFDFGRSFLF